MSKPVVLITSATSRNGTEAAELLLAQNKQGIRLAARDPAKLASLVAKGAEAVALDPSSSESMAQGCSGVDFVYLILPSLVSGAEIVMFHNFLQAAKSGGVKHVVYMSSMDADPSKDIKTFHSNYDHEQKLLSSGIPSTVLRPTWFYENAVANHAESIRRTGEFCTSSGEGVWTSIAIRDIAAAAVAVLNNPGHHAGKVYTLDTEAVTDKALAEKISKVAGKTVSHVNLTPEEHAEMIKNFFQRSSSADEIVHALVTLDEEKRRSL